MVCDSDIATFWVPQDKLDTVQQLLHRVQLILRDPESGYVRVAHHAEVLMLPSGKSHFLTDRN